VFAKTDNVVDVDDSSIADAPHQLLLVDRRKAPCWVYPSKPS